MAAPRDKRPDDSALRGAAMLVAIPSLLIISPLVGFFRPDKDFVKDLPDWTADWPEPNNIVLHYPLSGARVGASREMLEHVSMRRGDTPPLAVYREEER